MNLKPTATAFGFLTGVGVCLPLLGQTIPAGGRALSLMVVCAAVGVFLPPSVKKRAPGHFVIAALLAAALVALTIGAAAQPSQFIYATNYRAWGDHAARYYESKLLMFAITFAPAMGLAVCMAFIGDIRGAVKGYAAALVAMGAYGMTVLLTDWQYIARTDFWTSRNWFMGQGRESFSTISMGLLLAIAGLSTFAFYRNRDRRIAILTGVFLGVMLFGVFWLNRRADTVLFAIAIVAIPAAASLLVWRRFTVRVFSCSLIAMLTAAVLAAVLANTSNWLYWTTLSEAAQYRQEFANETLSGNMQIWEGDPIPTQMVPAAVMAGAKPSPFGGAGLGSFALHNGALYPHNVALELYQEAGPLAVAGYFCLGIILLLSLFVAQRRGTLDMWSLSAYSVAGLVAVDSLKTGDITSMGLVVFTTLVSVAAGTHSNRIPTGYIKSQSASPAE